jgi:predicted patatin/cPLA2 family phospholipase
MTKSNLFFRKAVGMDMLVQYGLLAVAVLVVAMVPSLSSCTLLPPGAEALNLNNLRSAPVRKYRQFSFRRRYRRLDEDDVQEQSRVSVSVNVNQPLHNNIKRTTNFTAYVAKRFSRSSSNKAQVQATIPSTTNIESGLPTIIPPSSPLELHQPQAASQQVPSQQKQKSHSEPKTSSATTTKGAAAKQEPVTDVHELRRIVLDEGTKVSKVPVALQVSNTSVSELLNHQVVQLMVERFHSQSTPGNRHATDTARLALSMEGGGMRGAVSAGMAAAIASLGLCDAFDVIYGSSAGSVIGAYMVSRQMCLDVYVDILPAAKRSFVCKKRLISSMATQGVDWVLSRLMQDDDLPKLAHKAVPGMNISFILDGIMGEAHGVRPLDLEKFRENDQKQPLRVASSYVKNHKLYTKSFGTRDFFPKYSNETVTTASGRREGLFACLQASMTVPGATGPPVRIQKGNETLPYFDAFCFEPLPYRSAVEEGATHCLVLCSRPEGFQPKVKPGVYEKFVTPNYFKSHGEPAVASFFQRGGQQYIYAEDLLTLEEGKRAGMNQTEQNSKWSSRGVLVPPPQILYGVERDAETERVASQRDDWNRAHLLPLKVPVGTPELAPLEQGRDEVLEAVRGGYAAAFDLLAPAIGLELSANLTGEQVAKLVFPDAHNKQNDGMSLLEFRVQVDGDGIGTISETIPIRRRKRDAVGRVFKFILRTNRKKAGLIPQPHLENEPSTNDGDDDDDGDSSDILLSMLPGFQAGKMSHLAEGLRSTRTML